MKKYLKKITTRLLVQLVVLFTLLIAPLGIMAPVFAHGCLSDDGHGSLSDCLDAGSCANTTGANCAPQASAETKVNSTIKLVLNMLSFIVGIIAVIMVIVGGLKYITSSGESSNVSSAKNTILYAIIGLIVVVLAQVIVRFVLQKTATVPAGGPPATMIRST